MEEDASTTPGAAALESLLAVVAGHRLHDADRTERLVALAIEVTEHLGLGAADAERAEALARLRDVGKLSLPPALLEKAGELTREERATLCEHPEIAARVVGGIPAAAPLAPLLLAQQERWDGLGYPRGLRGEEIPVACRVVFVCDAYLAMTSDRPYRPAIDETVAAGAIRTNAGSQFCPASAEALLAVLEGHGVRPPGSSAVLAQWEKAGLIGGLGNEGEPAAEAPAPLEPPAAEALAPLEPPAAEAPAPAPLEPPADAAPVAEEVLSAEPSVPAADADVVAPGSPADEGGSDAEASPISADARRVREMLGLGDDGGGDDGSADAAEPAESGAEISAEAVAVRELLARDRDEEAPEPDAEPEPRPVVAGEPDAEPEPRPVVVDEEPAVAGVPAQTALAHDGTPVHLPARPQAIRAVVRSGPRRRHGFRPADAFALALGLAIGLVWALPLRHVTAQCPPVHEGQLMCQLQKAGGPAITQVAASILGCFLLVRLVTETLPGLPGRVARGEVLPRKDQPDFAADPTLVAANWGLTYTDAHPKRRLLRGRTWGTDDIRRDPPSP